MSIACKVFQAPLAMGMWCMVELNVHNQVAVHMACLCCLQWQDLKGTVYGNVSQII